jgi:cell division FtsZ-interacting protein ZapD
MGDLNEWMAKAEAYDSLNERIGDLAAQLHDRDMLIQRLEEDLEVLREAEAQNAELLKAINSRPDFIGDQEPITQYCSQCKEFADRLEKLERVNADLKAENKLLRNTKPATILVSDDAVISERLKCLEQVEAQNAEFLKAINDAYPTIAGHVISLEKAGETVAHEQWASLARQLYAAIKGGSKDK